MLQPNKHLETNINMSLLPKIYFNLRGETRQNSHISHEQEKVIYKSFFYHQLVPLFKLNVKLEGNYVIIAPQDQNYLIQVNNGNTEAC